MIKFSLLGETILEWNDKDIEHYHARRMAMDSMLCRFKDEHLKQYPSGDIDLDDLMIGHSYFLADSVASLDLKWQYEVLPLLEEYYKDGLISKPFKE